jgi:hypothetical protein
LQPVVGGHTQSLIEGRQQQQPNTDRQQQQPNTDRQQQQPNTDRQQPSNTENHWHPLPVCQGECPKIFPLRGGIGNGGSKCCCCLPACLQQRTVRGESPKFFPLRGGETCVVLGLRLFTAARAARPRPAPTRPATHPAPSIIHNCPKRVLTAKNPNFCPDAFQLLSSSHRLPNTL